MSEWTDVPALTDVSGAATAEAEAEEAVDVVVAPVGPVPRKDR
jgi:hypothetical protein